MFGRYRSLGAAPGTADEKSKVRFSCKHNRFLLQSSNHWSSQAGQAHPRITEYSSVACGPVLARRRRRQVRVWCQGTWEYLHVNDCAVAQAQMAVLIRTILRQWSSDSKKRPDRVARAVSGLKRTKSAGHSATVRLRDRQRVQVAPNGALDSRGGCGGAPRHRGSLVSRVIAAISIRKWRPPGVPPSNTAEPK